MRRRRPRRSSTSRDHAGFGRAVEMCSGVGLCRKKREGTMCPSYMVTREEAHSTRGRANTLRLAMAGQLGDAKLSDKGVHEVLDLCLECRACKSECPVGVDVARFKSEFLAGYWDRHGAVADRSGVWQRARAAVWGSRFAPLSNTMANSRIARWAAEKTDRHRSPAIAAAMDAADVAKTAQGSGIGDRGSGESRAAVRGHFHRSCRSGDRSGRDRRDECRGHHRRTSRRTCVAAAR